MSYSKVHALNYRLSLPPQWRRLPLHNPPYAMRMKLDFLPRPGVQQSDCHTHRHTHTFFFRFFFWPCCAACRILVPRPVIEPMPLCWKHRVLLTGPPGSPIPYFPIRFLFVFFLALTIVCNNFIKWFLCICFFPYAPC